MSEAAKQPVERKTLDERHRMSDLERLRHSCAHIMATAVLRLWPDARLDIGPPTDEGFYYDFDLPSHRFSTDDFETIEAEMKKVIKENHVFEKQVKTRDEALAFFTEKGQKFKVERLADIPEGEPISFFQSGEFTDLCSFNEYVGWYVGLPEKIDQIHWTIKYPKPVFISEFGAGAKQGFHADATTRFSEELQADVYRRTLPMLEKIPGFSGCTPWILCDFRSPKRLLSGIQDGYNRKGLIGSNGQKKAAFTVLQDLYGERAKQDAIR